MRAIITTTLLVGAFMAGVLVAQTNTAEAGPQPKKAQWQYQCFRAETAAKVTERSNKMGLDGWEW